MLGRLARGKSQCVPRAQRFMRLWCVQGVIIGAGATGASAVRLQGSAIWPDTVVFVRIVSCVVGQRAGVISVGNKGTLCRSALACTIWSAVVGKSQFAIRASHCRIPVCAPLAITEFGRRDVSGVGRQMRAKWSRTVGSA